MTMVPLDTPGACAHDEVIDFVLPAEPLVLMVEYITDDDPELNTGEWDVVYGDGRFSYRYRTSTREGTTWHIRPPGGVWQGKFRFHYEPESGGGTVAAPIWEWNGTDTSQFEASPLTVTDSGGGGEPLVSLTAIADATVSPYGKYLQFRAQNGSGFGWCRVWLALASLPLEYTMELEYEGTGSAGEADNSLGLALLGHDDAGQFTGLGFTPGWFHCEAGARASLSYSAVLGRMAGPSASYSKASLRVHAVKTPGAPPTFRITNAQSGVASLTNAAAAKYVGSELLTQASLTMGSAWNDALCDRFGFAVRKSTGDHSLRIYRWRIYGGS